MNTEDVADFILATSLDKLPTEVVARAKISTLDTLGAIIAGHRTKTVSIVRNFVRARGGAGEATLYGLGLRAPLDGAALVNGTMATVLDTDDGCAAAVGHIGHVAGCVIPAALTVAENQCSSGAEFLEAVVAGYEVALRTGWMLCEPKQRRFPLSGTNGAYGATAAAAKLMNLTKKETVNAIGICEAYTPMPKMGKIALTGPMTKEAMPWGSMTGIIAAVLARNGFTGPVTVFDDPNYDTSPLTTLGLEYMILSMYFKPYCACRFTHSALDCIMELIKKQSLKAEEIVSITVGTGDRATLLSSPRPSTIEHAEYSFPFVIGAAMVDGMVGPEQISDFRLGDRAILNIADRVKVVTSDTVDKAWPAKYGAAIEVETKDGRNIKAYREYPRGGPEEPLSIKELEGKFMAWSTTVIDKSQAVKILDCVNNLEKSNSISHLIDLLSYF